MVAGDVRTHYATDSSLVKRQRLWATARAEPAFSLFAWVLQWVHGSVLDVGCGNGSYLALVDGAVGLDSSPGMLQAARSRARGPLVCGDAQGLPFTDATFDTVLAPHMLYHVPDRAAAAHELRRVLRPDGVLVAVTNSDSTQDALRSLVEGAVGGGWRWRPPSGDEFSMENGADQLRVAFRSVETVWAPEVTFHVTDADTVADYVDSIRDAYEAEVAQPWDAVVEECRRTAAEVITRDGELTIVGRVGAFVCR